MDTDPTAASEPSTEGQWRVYSDGTPRGTYVYTPDGQRVDQVYDLDFNVSASDPLGRLRLEITPAGITMLGVKPEIVFTCPACSESIDHTCGPPF
jgi:hypothetical protein